MTRSLNFSAESVCAAIIAVETVVVVERAPARAVFFRVPEIRSIAADMRERGYVAGADRLDQAATCAEAAHVPPLNGELPLPDLAAHAREALQHLLRFKITCADKQSTVAELLALTQSGTDSCVAARAKLLSFGLRRLRVRGRRDPYLALEYKNPRVSSLFATLGKTWCDLDGALTWRAILEKLPGVVLRHRVHSLQNGLQYALLIPWALIDASG